MKSVSEIDGGLKIPSSFYLEMPSNAKLYAEAVRIISQKAPLRIFADEKIAGAATLKEATSHQVPILGERSISHTTIGFEHALKVGYNGIKEQINSRLSRGGLDDDQMDILESMLSCIDSAGIWKDRYLEELKETGNDEVSESLKNVPENPPANFREAVQALWLLWDFQRLCGNWSGIGRIDKMLGPFLKRDLAAGKINIDEARELIAHFWIKGCEWITAEDRGSGDAQFYQNVVLAGVDEDGEEVANEVTDLVLDVVEELHISDFPIAVRLSEKTDERLLRRVATIQRLGGGIIAVYNEDQIIPTLVKFGYPLKEARNFANDGCWEILIPGKTRFGYQPFDALLLLQETLGLSATDMPPRINKVECFEHGQHTLKKGILCNYPDFETLYQDFKNRLTRTVEALIDNIPFSDLPCPLISLMVEGCIASGKSYTNGGPKYNVASPHLGGLPDVANSLLVIQTLVCENKEMTLSEFVEILWNDWNGKEAERQQIFKRFNFYGNDTEKADAMLRRVFDDYTEIVGRNRKQHGILRPAGISTFGREMSNFISHRTATASGQRKGEYLATNFSPTPGTDKDGPTAVIKSHCSVDFSKLPCGTALELKIPPANLKGEKGLTALVGLMKSFISLGGIFMQIDVVDTEMLRDAQLHPEKYPNLAVRVSGWSARFATLSEQWQELIINRSEQKI
jgi:pyruvate-formate lyase